MGCLSCITETQIVVTLQNQSSKHNIGWDLEAQAGHLTQVFFYNVLLKKTDLPLFICNLSSVHIKL